MFFTGVGWGFHLEGKVIGKWLGGNPYRNGSYDIILNQEGDRQ